jgi:hypothetical protein
VAAAKTLAAAALRCLGMIPPETFRMAFWCNLVAVPSWCPTGWFEGGVMARFLGIEELFEGWHFHR